MKSFLCLLLLSALAQAASIEIRKVVEAGEGKKVLECVRTHEGNEQREQLTLADEVIVDGDDIKAVNAEQVEDTAGIRVLLTEGGAKKLSEATKNVGNGGGRPRFAVIVDGKIISAPVVMTQLSQQFVVTGLEGGIEEAKALAARLNTASAEK